MLGKKVVVKFKDGKILKGWTANISPNKEVFNLHKCEEFREKDKKDTHSSDNNLDKFSNKKIKNKN